MMASASVIALELSNMFTKLASYGHMEEEATTAPLPSQRMAVLVDRSPSEDREVGQITTSMIEQVAASIGFRATNLRSQVLAPNKNEFPNYSEINNPQYMFGCYLLATPVPNSKPGQARWTMQAYVAEPGALFDKHGLTQSELEHLLKLMKQLNDKTDVTACRSVVTEADFKTENPQDFKGVSSARIVTIMSTLQYLGLLTLFKKENAEEAAGNNSSYVTVYEKYEPKHLAAATIKEMMAIPRYLRWFTILPTSALAES